MAKYKEKNYLQIYKSAIKQLNEHNPKISYSTRWLYTHLCLLEHRFTGKEKDFFFRSIRDLHDDTGIGTKQIVKGIKVLKEIGLIQAWQMHWQESEQKKSRKHITAFRLLDVY